MHVKPGIFKFKAALASKLNEISFNTNVTAEIIATVGKQLQNEPDFADDESVKNLKFSNNFITNFLKRHGFRDKPGKLQRIPQ